MSAARAARGVHPLLVLALLAVAYVSAAAGLLWWSTSPMVVGWQPTVVLTGSMQPALDPGDVVLVGPVPGADPLPLNRIALVRDPSRDTGTYLHRVVEHTLDGAVVTRGDANPTDDPEPVPTDRVLGQVRLVVPAVGLPAVWLHRGAWLPLGAVVAVTWAALLLTGAAVRRVRAEGRGRHGLARPPQRRLGAALATVAVAGATALAAGPLAPQTTEAPWSASWTSAGNVVATGTWAPGNLLWWGSGGAGQGGARDVSAGWAMTEVPSRSGSPTVWKSVASGEAHTCAIAANDSLWCWGRNGDGQLGTGSTTSTSVPAQVSGGGAWSAVDTGTRHTCAVRTTGTVWCWGSGEDGRLGTGSTTASTVPVQTQTVAGFTNVTRVAVGDRISCATTTATTDPLWCWGAVLESTPRLAPAASYPDGTVTSLSAGGDTACAVISAALWCLGANTHGQMGTVNPAYTPKDPVQVAAMSGATSVAVGPGFVCATRAVTGGTGAYCAGTNGAGEHGAGPGPSSTTFVQVGTALDWSALATAGGEGATVCGTRSASSMWCWGDADHGQLADGAPRAWATPSQVSGTWKQASAGGDHLCAVSATDRLLCAGSNLAGQAGTARTPEDAVTATQVGAMRWVEVAVGPTSTCAVDHAGALWCWGANESGQLGTGGTTPSVSPVRVGSATSWAAVAVGDAHACATRNDGSLWCWGDNSKGQLGVATGDRTNRGVPTPVAGGSTWTLVTATARHTCGVTTAGAVQCWGDNARGQLGNGTTTDQTVPTGVTGTTTYRDVSTGRFHTCAVSTSAQLWCWGDQRFSQTGVLHSTSLQPSPASNASTFSTWLDVAAGDLHTCAVRSEGVVACWGSNADGRTGNGAATTTATADTAPLLTGVVGARVAVGARHSCVLKPDASVVCVGDNAEGQLGNGGTADVRTAGAATSAGVATALFAGGSSTFALAGTGGSAPDYRGTVAGDSPTGAWRLDDIGTTTAAAAAGVAGTYSGSPALGAAGAMAGSSAPRFDGVDDRVQLADAPYDFAGRAPFSVEAWVRRSSGGSGYPRLVAKEEWLSGTQCQGWGLLTDPGTGSVMFERCGGGTPEGAITDAVLHDGAWHHVVGTYDGSTLRVYVDGVERASAASTTSVPDLAGPVFVGSMGYNDWFTGGIDEVALYATALSPARVAAHHAAGT